MAQGVKMKPISVIEANLGIQRNGPIHKFFTKRCAEHMDKYVPFHEGQLAYDNRIIEDDKIIYQSPYAHYMYIGDVMGPNIPIKENGVIVGWWSKGPKSYTGQKIKYNQTAGHEYAGPYWDKRMWSAEKDDVVQEVQNFIQTRR